MTSEEIGSEAQVGPASKADENLQKAYVKFHSFDVDTQKAKQSLMKIGFSQIEVSSEALSQYDLYLEYPKNRADKFEGVMITQLRDGATIDVKLNIADLSSARPEESMYWDKYQEALDLLQGELEAKRIDE